MGFRKNKSGSTTEQVYDLDGQIINKFIVHGVTCYYNGEQKLHRIGGPAVIYPDGESHWVVDGLPTSIPRMGMWIRKYISEDAMRKFADQYRDELMPWALSYRATTERETS